MKVLINFENNWELRVLKSTLKAGMERLEEHTKQTTNTYDFAAYPAAKKTIQSFLDQVSKELREEK